MGYLLNFSSFFYVIKMFRDSLKILKNLKTTNHKLTSNLHKIYKLLIAFRILKLSNIFVYFLFPHLYSYPSKTITK